MRKSAPLFCALLLSLSARRAWIEIQQAQGVRLKFSEQPRNDFPFFPLAAAGFADFTVAFIGCVPVRFFLRRCREGQNAKLAAVPHNCGCRVKFCPFLFIGLALGVQVEGAGIQFRGV